MPEADREKWNQIWESRGSPGEPSPWVRHMCEKYFPTRGSALDVAGGAGRHSLVLAEHGLEVTCSDISDVGVRIAAGLHPRIHPDRRDLEVEDPPAAMFDAILVFHYLNRSLLSRLHERLTPGGVLAVCVATIRNLEKHPHPSARFLLQPQELRRTLQGLEILDESEDWNESGFHEARIVARKAGDQGRA